MGNQHATGFRKVPNAYLRDLRRKTDKRYRSLVMSQRPRLSSSGVEKERMGDGPRELTPESVTEFVSSNPDFLDEYVTSNISQDRVKEWIKEPTEDGLEALMSVQDEDMQHAAPTHFQSSRTTLDISKSKEEATSSGQSSEQVHKKIEKAEWDKKYNKQVMERRNQQIGLMVVNRQSLLYPRKHKREELADLIERQSTFEELELDSHFFSYTEVASDDLSHVFIKMAHNLMGKHAFPMVELTYFLSTLRANYNNVEYHNYHHALSHAQSMYWVLRKNPGVFTELEMKALMIASISHDVGHPGLDDYYMKKVSSGFQLLYDPPLLEHHHAQTCFQILQDKNCNVFCGLDADDYRKVLNDIKHAILSTTFERYKLQVEKLRQMMESGTNLQNPTTRKAIKSLTMMACDLCGTWKRWEEHKGIVWKLYKEFFNQSDLEAHLGIPSKPYRMRAAADAIPQSQVSFMESIALPVFQLLSDVFPPLRAINKAAKDNMECWKTY